MELGCGYCPLCVAFYVSHVLCMKVVYNVPSAHKYQSDKVYSMRRCGNAMQTTVGWLRDVHKIHSNGLRINMSTRYKEYSPFFSIAIKNKSERFTSLFFVNVKIKNKLLKIPVRKLKLVRDSLVAFLVLRVGEDLCFGCLFDTLDLWACFCTSRQLTHSVKIVII